MVYVHLAEGFEEIEAIAIVDVLRRAGIEVCTVSVENKLLVAGAHGIAVEADMLYEDAFYEACEMIVLPGGMPGTTNLGGHKGLMKHVECFAKDGKFVGAICAAPMLLGERGLLEGRTATIYTGMEANLEGAKHSDEKVVVDGNIITSKGPGTAVEFALTLSELLAGKPKAQEVRRGLLLGSKSGI